MLLFLFISPKYKILFGIFVLKYSISTFITRNYVLKPKLIYFIIPVFTEDLGMSLNTMSLGSEV
jgi:hypothetical protein